jgi:hypothetical protein
MGQGSLRLILQKVFVMTDPKVFATCFALIGAGYVQVRFYSGRQQLRRVTLKRLEDDMAV